MSDMSVLSQEYKTASDVSQAISNALIALKKTRYNLPDADSAIPVRLNHNVQTLTEILTSLIDLLSSREGQDAVQVKTIQLPEALIARLQAEHRGDIAYYLDDLSRLTEQIQREPSHLSNEDIALLDHLAGIADAEASSVFRKLMRM